MAVSGAMSLVPSTTAGRSPQMLCTGTSSAFISDRVYAAEALLAGHQSVAVVFVLHLALGQSRR